MLASSWGISGRYVQGDAMGSVCALTVSIGELR